MVGILVGASARRHVVHFVHLVSFGRSVELGRNIDRNSRSVREIHIEVTAERGNFSGFRHRTAIEGDFVIEAIIDCFFYVGKLRVVKVTLLDVY